MALFQGRWIQVWQYGQPAAAETGLADAAALCQTFGYQGLLVKAFDGDDWMRKFDDAADALGSVAQVAEQRDFCRARGLGYGVWVNPLFGDQAFLDRQAELYAAVGNVTNLMAWDTEPFDKFWGANRPAGAAARLMGRFRDLAPGCVNVWQPDPRPGRLAELRPGEWAPQMNVYAPQIYWTDFRTTPASEVERAVAQQPDLGIAELAPTLPGAASAAELGAAVDLLGQHSAAACVVWRLGSTNAASLRAARDGKLSVPTTGEIPAEGAGTLPIRPRTLDESPPPAVFDSKPRPFQIIAEDSPFWMHSQAQYDQNALATCGPIAVAHAINMTNWALGRTATINAGAAVDACAANGSFAIGDQTQSIPGLGAVITQQTGIPVIYQSTMQSVPGLALSWEAAKAAARDRWLIVNLGPAGDVPGHISVLMGPRSGGDFLWLMHAGIRATSPLNGAGGRITPELWPAWSWQTLVPDRALWRLPVD
jgi:hypothetical protein